MVLLLGLKFTRCKRNRPAIWFSPCKKILSATPVEIRHPGRKRMDSAQYERVKQLFELHRMLPEAERDTRLASDAAGDAEVEHEVRALLEAYDRSADFLEQPVLEQQAEIVERAIRPAAELAAGTRI